MSADVAALLLADARLPTGAHAHSAGLEPALLAGMAPEEVPDYIRARLCTVGLVEAAAAVLAARVAESPDGLRTVQEALQARMPSAPARAAAELLGRGLARLARRVAPDHPAVLGLDSLDMAPLRPVALGALARAVGLEEDQVARVSLYDDVQTVTAASLKLLPVDPADATAWVLDAAPTLEQAVARAVAVSGPDSLPAVTAPLVEQYSLDHDRRTRRIFVA